jgi:hypothetical protein
MTRLAYNLSYSPDAGSTKAIHGFHILACIHLEVFSLGVAILTLKRNAYRNLGGFSCDQQQGIDM